MMPGMDGITTLEVMRSKFDMRNVSVIALTADAVAGAREFYLERYRRGIMASAVSVPILVTAAAVAIHSHRKKKKTYSSIPKME